MRKGTCVIVFALLVLVAGCGSSGNGGGSSNANEVTVDLGEQNGSGESGTATLTEEGDKTKVVLDLQTKMAQPRDVPQPAHIHKGSCAELDPNPEYALANVEGGQSTTTVDAKLDDLKKGDFAINVHKSATEAATYVACGDIGTGTSSGGSSGGNGY